jgi:hypothetical protein
MSNVIRYNFIIFYTYLIFRLNDVCISFSSFYMNIVQILIIFIHIEYFILFFNIAFYNFTLVLISLE